MRRFIVVGKPIPKGNKVPIRKGNGKLGVRERNPDAAGFGQLVKILSAKSLQAGNHKTLDGPTAVQVHFSLGKPGTVPKVRRGWPAAKPDADKLIRTVLDGLSNVQYKDDNGICWLLITKQYAMDGIPPTTTIQIDPLKSHGEACIPCLNCDRLQLMVEKEC